MDDWFHHWFDEDYERLYAHRDQAEAQAAVTMLFGAAPSLREGVVLDLGCGAGRHLQAMRTLNPRCVGLDLSQHLLRTAPESLRGHLLRGDMRHLPFRPGSLAGVTLWFTPFGYFSDASNRQVLVDVALRLAPDGWLLMDFLNAAQVRRSLVATESFVREGLQVAVTRAIEGDHVVKRMRLERLDSGACREVVERVRLYEPHVLEAMAQAAGLKLHQVWGGYHHESFAAETSCRWIGLFRRA